MYLNQFFFKLKSHSYTNEFHVNEIDTRLNVSKQKGSRSIIYKV